MAVAHARLLRACAPDAMFVCNSPQSRETLISLDPAREPYATVIPCAVAPQIGSLAGILPHVVMQRHITFRALGQQDAAPPSGWSAPGRDTSYVLSVSTLEPRKNFSGLIRGWERVTARSDPGLRLVIVGEAGWHEAQVLSDMRAGVAAGRILHLQHLPQEDLQALMRGAACFAFPSFNEGFGYTPLEALQAGTPCLVSDLPVFRWIFGDSALYADPYDTDSIATGIERLVSGPNSADLAASLASRADKVLARFRPSAIAEAWEAMLHAL
jgi:glycosyltransferase involved in cell wall biosynthesis